MITLSTTDPKHLYKDDLNDDDYYQERINH